MFVFRFDGGHDSIAAFTPDPRTGVLTAAATGRLAVTGSPVQNASPVSIAFAALPAQPLPRSADYGDRQPSCPAALWRRDSAMSWRPMLRLSWMASAAALQMCR